MSIRDSGETEREYWLNILKGEESKNSQRELVGMMDSDDTMQYAMMELMKKNHSPETWSLLVQMVWDLRMQIMRLNKRLAMRDLLSRRVEALIQLTLMNEKERKNKEKDSPAPVEENKEYLNERMYPDDGL